MAQGVAGQIADHLAQLGIRPFDQRKFRSVLAIKPNEGNVPVRCLRRCVRRRIADCGSHVDGADFCAALAVEPGQHHKVFDEVAHADGFCFDSAHDLGDVFGFLHGTLPVELRVAADGDKRGAQFVGCVRHELADALLRGLAPVEGVLNVTEHGVQRTGQTTEFGGGGVFSDALR